MKDLSKNHFAAIPTDLGLIELRPYTAEHVGAQMDYLYNSPKEFLEGIGFDTKKLNDREAHESKVRDNLSKQRDEDFKSVVAELNGVAVAIVHLHLGDEANRAHFHILDSKSRHKGLGKPILLNSLKLLMEKHSLNELNIEPKSDNIPMNRLLKKCGFKFLGTCHYPVGPLTKAFEANRYLVVKSKIFA